MTFQALAIPLSCLPRQRPSSLLDALFKGVFFFLVSHFCAGVCVESADYKPISSPEPAILLVSTKNAKSGQTWPDLISEVCADSEFAPSI